jgi:hypothetical protein
MCVNTMKGPCLIHFVRRSLSRSIVQSDRPSFVRMVNVLIYVYVEVVVQNKRRREHQRIFVCDLFSATD